VLEILNELISPDQPQRKHDRKTEQERDTHARRLTGTVHRRRQGYRIARLRLGCDCCWDFSVDKRPHDSVDLAALASSDDSTLVGRLVDLGTHGSVPWQQRAVSGSVPMTSRLFVLPGDAVHLRQGARVNIRGFVLELPEGMKDRLDDYLAARDEAIYVYANQVRTL
jgi:hypothetical protein